MFRIQPVPRARMPGRTSVARWNGASTWTANMSAYRFAVNSSAGTK